MAYKKQTWVDLETPLDAEHMNHIEDGIGSISEENAKQLTTKPLVYIDGVIPTTKDEVLAELTYEHGPERWHAYIKIKCQGNSSMQYPKKNFTVKLYSDEARETKLKKKMFGWPIAQNKYVLKANYIDHTHARNIVDVNLWSETVASRPDYDTLPEELRNSPNNGAIDGYPIIAYTNGNYQGLYTWNIGKDDWMWGMDEDNPNHVLMCAEYNSSSGYREMPCNFRALWSGVNEDFWSVEIGTNSEAVKTAMNDLITCVKDTDDETFRATIGDYLDVQSAIDYYLLTCADCGVDSLGKNLVIGTYDLKKWYVGAYDRDATWLLNWNGALLTANTACPGQYQERYSLLWERLTKLYKSELYARGKELRKKVLSYANIMSRFERFCASVGNEAYADDLVPYPDIPSGDANNIWQLRNAVRDRLNYFDAWLESEFNSDAMFKLAAPATFEKYQDFLGTTVNFCDRDMDWTILIDFTPETQETVSGKSNYMCICYSPDVVDYTSGLKLYTHPNYNYYLFRYETKGSNRFSKESNIPRTSTTRSVMVMRHKEGSHTYEVYSHNGTEEYSESVSLYFYTDAVHTNQRLGFGGHGRVYKEGTTNVIADETWKGTINRCELYNSYYTNEEVAAFAAGAFN